MINEILLSFNAIFAAAICLRLVLARSPGHHHAGRAWLAWILSVWSGSAAIRIVFGVYGPIGWTDVALSLAVALGVFYVHGDFSRLFRRRTVHVAFAGHHIGGRNKWKN